MSTPTRSALLRKTTYAFCQAFLRSAPPPEILDHSFVPDNPKITEHGPSWARSRLPFLAKTFSGRKECEDYFTILVEVLDFLPAADTFPGPDGIVVDAEAGEGDETADGRKGIVHVRAKGTFRAKKTGNQWQEVFAYRLSDFDEQGRIGHWEIFADPLSAWMAVGNEDLEKVQNLV
jgi:hypothetical protein